MTRAKPRPAAHPPHKIQYSRKDVSLQHCNFSRLHCNDPDDAATIRELAGIAEKQGTRFSLLSPWKTFLRECRPEATIYVASKKTPNTRLTITEQSILPKNTEVCGWMTIYEDVTDGVKTWYLGEVVSANAMDMYKTYKGIGETFIELLYKDAFQQGVGYIYMLSLGSARSFYESWKKKGKHISMVKKEDLRFSPLFKSVGKNDTINPTTKEYTKGEPTIDTWAALQDARRQEERDAVYMYIPIKSSPDGVTIARWIYDLKNSDPETDESLIDHLCEIFNCDEDGGDFTRKEIEASWSFVEDKDMVKALVAQYLIAEEKNQEEEIEGAINALKEQFTIAIENTKMEGGKRTTKRTQRKKKEEDI